MKKTKKIRITKKVLLVSGVALCFLAALFWVGYSSYQKEKNSDEQVVERLSTLIVLPEEIPTIATVSDKEKLADEAFFAKAENGDKVVVFKQARRAYLYRPGENKIIDMTVVAVEQPSLPTAAENVPVFQVPEN